MKKLILPLVVAFAVPLASAAVPIDTITAATTFAIQAPSNASSVDKTVIRRYWEANADYLIFDQANSRWGWDDNFEPVDSGSNFCVYASPVTKNNMALTVWSVPCSSVEEDMPQSTYTWNTPIDELSADVKSGTKKTIHGFVESLSAKQRLAFVNAVK
jgi:hypothetical protein